MEQLQSISAERVIASAVEFTDAFAADQIRRSFSGALREMLPTEDVVILAPSQDSQHGVSYAVRYADLSPSSESLEFRRELQDGASWFTPECMLTIQMDGRRIMNWRGSTILMQPVTHQDRISEIVLLRASRFDRDALSIIAGFVRLYRNFLGLKLQGELDPLTGLLNRRTLDTRLAEVLREAASQERRRDPRGDRRDSACDKRQYLAIIDIDHFKRINDTLGHLFGDEVIVRTAQEMRKAFRRSDLLFRYGGEEFVVAMNCSSAEHASEVLNRYRESMESIAFSQIGTVTVSIGFTEIDTAAMPAALVTRADQALYHAKENGRNQVVFFEEFATSGRINGAKVEHQDAEMF